MTPAEAWAGWLAMTWGDRLAFAGTLVDLGIIRPEDARTFVNVQGAQS